MNLYSNRINFHKICSAFTLLLIIAFIIPMSLSAQDTKYKPYQISDVSPADFAIESDIIESNAPAVYIFELGDSNVKNNINEWILEFTRSFRIKILTEEGLELADQIIELHIAGNSEEKIGRVKGGVYNLVNGKIEFEKLRNSDWLVDDYDQSAKTARMTFKNVKVGSIIDLSYTVFSPFLARMPDWEFQHDNIPVLYSEYYIRYPEMLGYKILQYGYHPLLASLHTTEREMDSGVGVSTTYKHKEVYILACENIPAMRKEPLMNSPENYRTKVITELNYVDYPGRLREFIYKDWVGGARDFLKEGFNEQFMDPKNRLDYFTLGNSDCENLFDSVSVIYNHIRESYSVSDEVNYKTPKRNPRQILDSQKATPSEINWILVATLRANSIDAYPILVSLRSTQRILKEYPLFTQFSSCLAVVKSGDQYTILDATSRGLKAGEISEYYYNGDGLMISNEQPQWVPIVGSWPTSEKCSIEFQTIDDGILNGEMRLQISGLYRTRLAKDLLTENLKDLIDELPVVKNAHLTLNAEKSDLNANPMDLRFDISMKLEKYGDSYLFPAVIYDDMSDNVLKDKDRQYPVDFPDNWSESYTCMVHLDNEKYNVEIPENSSFALPDQNGLFTFSGAYSFGSLLIRNKVEINKTSFSAQEYGALRRFYDLISTAHSSFIEITEK